MLQERVFFYLEGDKNINQSNPVLFKRFFFAILFRLTRFHFVCFMSGSLPEEKIKTFGHKIH